MLLYKQSSYKKVKNLISPVGAPAGRPHIPKSIHRFGGDFSFDEQGILSAADSVGRKNPRQSISFCRGFSYTQRGETADDINSALCYFISSRRQTSLVNTEIGKIILRSRPRGFPL